MLEWSYFVDHSVDRLRREMVLELPMAPMVDSLIEGTGVMLDSSGVIILDVPGCFKNIRHWSDGRW